MYVIEMMSRPVLMELALYNNDFLEIPLYIIKPTISLEILASWEFSFHFEE